MVRIAVIWPVNTDRQADKAALRILLDDHRLAKIDAWEEAKLAPHVNQIAQIRLAAEAKRAKVRQVRLPLGERLLQFTNAVRGRKRKYKLPSGAELEVFTATSVEAVIDDKAAIKELRVLGHEEFIRRRVIEEVDRASLGRLKNRHIVEAMFSLRLRQRQTLKVHPPK